MAPEQPIIARDFLGLGMMTNACKSSPVSNDVRAALVSPKGSAAPSTLQQSSLSGLGASPTSFVKNGTFLSSMDTGGIKHPVWSKPIAFQQHLARKNVPEERFVEHTAENALDRSYPHLLQPMQAWSYGDNIMKYASQACDKDRPSTFASSDFVGLKSKYTLSLSIPDADVHEGVTNVSGKRLPGPADDHDGAPLTIFYGGNINVFNDVSEEKAKAIMVLAESGNLQGSVVGTKLHGDLKTSHGFESANQGASGNISMCLDFDHTSVMAPGSPGQPVVPRALPQARKASLARFLEKRRERIHLKAPYIVKQADSSSPEERFSSSNDVASYKACSKLDTENQMTIATWMNWRMSKYITRDIVKEETNIVAA